MEYLKSIVFGLCLILSIKQWIIVLMYLPYVCHGVTLLFVAQTFWCDCELPQYHVHWMRLAPGQHLKSLKEHLICLNLSDNPFWLTLYITIDINDSPLNDAPKRCLAKQSIVVVFPTPGGPKNKLYFVYLMVYGLKTRNVIFAMLSFTRFRIYTYLQLWC